MRALFPGVLALAGCASVALPPPPDPFGSEAGISARRPAAPVGPAALGTRPGVASVLALADESNPEIAAARARYEAAGGREEQAGLWPNPDLRLEARDVPRHPAVLDEGGRWVELTQPIAPGGRIGAAREAASAERESLGWELAATRRRVAARVLAACADLSAANESLALRRRIATGAAALADAARLRAERGTGSESDAALLGIEAERAASDVRRAERSVAEARAAVRAVAGDECSGVEDVAWPGEGPSSRAPEGLEAHPSLRAAVARVAAAERVEAAARAARVPDVAVSVAYGRVGDDDEEFVEAALEVPLPVFDRNQGRIREATALVAAARADEWQVRREIARRRESAAAERAASSADLAAHRDRTVPAAERLAAQMEQAFATGSRSATDVALARRAAAEARIGLVEAERSLRRADAELADVAGTPPVGGDR